METSDDWICSDSCQLCDWGNQRQTFYCGLTAVEQLYDGLCVPSEGMASVADDVWVWHDDGNSNGDAVDVMIVDVVRMLKRL